jgi:hypothetical protein
MSKSCRLAAVQLDDPAFAGGLLALLQAPDDPPEVYASPPAYDPQLAATGAELEAEWHAFWASSSGPGGPDELAGCSVQRASSGVAERLPSGNGGKHSAKVYALALMRACCACKPSSEPGGQPAQPACLALSSQKCLMLVQASAGNDARQMRVRAINRASQNRWRARHKVRRAALVSARFVLSRPWDPCCRT